MDGLQAVLLTAWTASASPCCFPVSLRCHPPGQLWGDEPGEKALDEGMLPNLLAAGHMYEVEGLKAACEARLAAKATVSNALELLELAQECHAQVGFGTRGPWGAWGWRRDVVVPT